MEFSQQYFCSKTILYRNDWKKNPNIVLKISIKRSNFIVCCFFQFLQMYYYKSLMNPTNIFLHNRTAVMILPLYSRTITSSSHTINTHTPFNFMFFLNHTITSQHTYKMISWEAIHTQREKKNHKTQGPAIPRIASIIWSSGSTPHSVVDVEPVNCNTL